MEGADRSMSQLSRNEMIGSIPISSVIGAARRSYAPGASSRGRLEQLGDVAAAPRGPAQLAVGTERQALMTCVGRKLGG